MTSTRDESSRHAPIRQSRSLHDLFSGFFFFNHVDHSRITTSTAGDQKDPFGGGGGGGEEEEQRGHEGVSSDSNNAVALVFGRESSSGADEFRLIDSMAEVTCAVKLSRMRRSDTWDASLLRKSDDPFQPEAVPPAPPGPSTPLPSEHSTSGVISFAASGGDDTGTGNGLRGLLADIYRPDGTGSSRDTSAGSGPVSPASDAASARHSLSTLTLDAASAVASDDVSLLPTSPKHRSTMRRQFTLPAVLEAASGESKMAEKKRTQLLDINNNNNNCNNNNNDDDDAALEKASSLQGDTTPPSSPYGGQAKVSATDLALPPEAMKVPEAVSHPPPPPRKLGILDLFVAAAGDRKNVRNKDMNFMAPQSW